MIAKLKENMGGGFYIDPFSLAIVHIGLGENDEAFAWLAKALHDRSEMLLFYKDSPICDSIRADVRFTELLRRLNLAP